MMDFAIDLHINSALSPCGDEDMTPNNIINMAIIKGLDIISVTDHNSSANLSALWEVAVKNGIMLLPGIEVQTKEEIHSLCYFKTINEAEELGAIIYNSLPDIKNDEKLFGRQIIYDSKDEATGSLDKLLLSSSNLSITQLADIVKQLRGVLIPAHIDRKSYSLITNLGFIPKNLEIRTVEISKYANLNEIVTRFPYLNNLRIIRSSDAHYLWDISERSFYMTLEELTLTGIIEFLSGL